MVENRKFDKNQNFGQKLYRGAYIWTTGFWVAVVQQFLI